MPSKNFKKSAAVALSVAALGGLAFLPGASAATTTASGLFGIQSQDDLGHTGYAGLAAKSSNPGGGSTTNPGGGSTTEPSTPPTTEPATPEPTPVCTPLVADPATYDWNVSYDDYSYFFTPVEDGHSDWIDRVQAAGGTIKVGNPVITAPDLDIYTANGHETLHGVKLSGLESTIGDTLQIASKNTGVVSSQGWSNPGAADAFKYTSLKQNVNDRMQVDDATQLMSQPAFLDALSDQLGKNVKSANTYEWDISYPVSVVWKATGERASCESTSTPVNIVEYASA